MHTRGSWYANGRESAAEWRVMHTRGSWYANGRESAAEWRVMHTVWPHFARRPSDVAGEAAAARHGCRGEHRDGLRSAP